MTQDALGLELRTIQRDGRTYFHLLDVVRALRTAHPHRIISNLDPDEFISLKEVTGKESDADTYLVTEPAIFKIAIRMRSREARAFLRFICHEALTALRERGTYRLAPKAGADGANLVRYLRAPIAAAQVSVPAIPPTAEEADVPW